MVQLNGQWVTAEESYRARGYVQFEGEWMTPAKQQSILADQKASQAQAEGDRNGDCESGGSTVWSITVP